ncbi:MAG: hypothetical protein AAGG54_14620 [Pseudomonadota bacterium]
MTAHLASAINAIVLIIASIWAFSLPDASSLTTLIPAAFGIALLACYPGVKAQNKMIAHIAVLLTLLIFLALFMPLRGAIASGDTMGIVRVVAMLLTSLVALVFFIKSFVDARRARSAQ